MMRSKKYFLIIITCILFAVSILHGQTGNKTWFFAKSYKDSVALRWQINDGKLWQQHIKRGSWVYRRDLETNRYERISVHPVIPFNDTLWIFYEYYLKDTSRNPNRKIDENTLMVLSMQCPQRFSFIPDKSDVNNEQSELEKDTVSYRLFMHTLASYQTKEAGLVAGNYIVDKSVQKGKVYEYMLTKNYASADSVLARCTVSTATMSPVLTPEIFKDYTHKRKTLFKWKKLDTTFNRVPLYHVFRSENKDKGYTQLTEQALVSLFSSDGVDSLNELYEDATLEKGKVYYYKVQGIDLFWDKTPLSEPYRIQEKSFLETSPVIDSIELIRKKETMVHWTIAEQDLEHVKEIHVFRGKYYDSLYTRISPALKNTVSEFKDTKPGLRSYYKIMLVGQANDTLWSTVSYAHFPDTIKPNAPVITSAVCDSLGIVRIRWKHSNEEDLKFVKLLMSNNPNVEFAGILTVPFKDSILFDTLHLNVSSEFVYYKLQLLDNSYKPSDYSAVVKVQRYDTLAPSCPIILTATSDTFGIRLKWANSSASDVVKSTLFRRNAGDTSWSILKVFVKTAEPISYYTDSSLVKGNWYDYAFTASDFANNTSAFSPVYAVKCYDDGIRGTITDPKIKFDIKKKIVKLSWKCDEAQLVGFLIYRSRNGEPWDILTRTGGRDREFYDKEVGVGNVYRYRIKAVFADDAESPFCAELVAEF